MMTRQGTWPDDYRDYPPGDRMQAYLSDGDRDKIAALEAENERLRAELAETRAHEHVLVIVGDMLARHLEWMVTEPTPGLTAEVLDAIKGRAKEDTEQWLRAITNAGFKRPESRR
jgi:hypothetical protein